MLSWWLLATRLQPRVAKSLVGSVSGRCALTNNRFESNIAIFCSKKWNLVKKMRLKSMIEYDKSLPGMEIRLFMVDSVASKSLLIYPPGHYPCSDSRPNRQGEFNHLKIPFLRKIIGNYP